MNERQLAALPNLGPASGAGWWATANLLYALYAALEDKHWTEVTRAEKASLRHAAGLDDRR